jgi:hypothetical protein
LLRDDTEKPRIREHPRQEANGNVGVRKILREIVAIREGAEGFKANLSTRVGVGWDSPAN